MKRFTDTEIYEQEWFLGLTLEMKLLWDYVLRKCDAYGIWKINMIGACRLLEIDKIELKDFVECVNADKIRLKLAPKNHNRLIILQFMLFQWGDKQNRLNF